MRDISLVFIRHARSCSNLLPAVALDDPQLTVAGAAAARTYGPRLRRLLRARGIRVGADNVLLSSSGLTRATETAELLFPGQNVSVLPHIRKDDPDVPRNAVALLRHLYDRPQSKFIIIAHKGFISKNLMDALGLPARPEFNNLDSVLIRGRLSADGQIHGVRISDLSWHSRTHSRTNDKCSPHDRLKMRRPTPGVTRRHHGRHVAPQRPATRRRHAAAVQS